MLGVSAPVGAAGEIRATWNQYRDSWRYTGSGSDNFKANALALGYVHNLSKRTALYGTFAYIKNQNKSAPRPAKRTTWDRPWMVPTCA